MKEEGRVKGRGTSAKLWSSLLQPFRSSRGRPASPSFPGPSACGSRSTYPVIQKATLRGSTEALLSRRDFAMDQDNRKTSLLLFNFLQCSSNSFIQTELKELGQELNRPPHFQGGGLEDNYELQTDGNRSCHFEEEEESDSESQEEIIQRIAMQLAKIGDNIENSIQPRVVDELVQWLRNVNLSTQEKKKYLAATMEKVMDMQTISLDIGQEKATLLLTMLLAKKVMTHAPPLFRSVFQLTVDYINQNLRTYMRNLTRNEME
uniref:BH3-interacting domain death agonist n=1 Tax=Monodelphis domestica TaxID=13616 RepID=F7CU55_MONDO